MCLEGYIAPETLPETNQTSIFKEFPYPLTELVRKFATMATAAVQQQAPGNKLDQVIEPLAQQNKITKNDVETELHYYDDPGDGTPPAPSYVG